MKKFQHKPLVLSLALATSLLCACSDTAKTAPKDPAWDRATCHHCQMMISDHRFTAQIVNPDSGEHFFFDDLGCALKWLVRNKPAWQDRAVIYASSAKDGTWVDVKKGVIATGFVTPMSYGFGAFASKGDVPADKTIVSLDKAQGMTMQEKSTPRHHMPMSH